MLAILGQYPLGFQWETEDPFLFCVHHLDFYPKGNAQMGPDASLLDRFIGQDFDLSNSWKMYHGSTVPGFPVHPHRGFETVTVVLDGYVDHFDSFGSSGRYGAGDVQWMTAGSGMQHAEMFPLIHKEKPNPLHLFQIWLNLPKKSKFVEPHYKMLWSEDIPKLIVCDNHIVRESSEPKCEVALIAGKFQEISGASPAPDSWAATPENNVDIMLLTMDTGAKIVLDSKSSTCNRNIYFYEGSTIQLNNKEVLSENRICLGNIDVTVVNTGKIAHILVLQGEPINETVVQYGPFVMNSNKEIQEAYNDYNETSFGGWPWDRLDPVNKREAGRFAKNARSES